MPVHAAGTGASTLRTPAVPPVVPMAVRRLLAPSVVLVLLGLAALGPGVRGPGAVAVEVYAPRGIEAATVPSGDWLALEVRAAGFRPNSVVLLDVGGAEQGTVMADAAGVVEARVPLPDRVGVRVRGVAVDGGGLDLGQEVRLVRGVAPGGAVLVASGLLLVLLGWVARGLRAGRPGSTGPGHADPRPDAAPGR